MRIHFIRHGESEHNARFEAGLDPLALRFDATLRDAGLTALGRAQAEALTTDMRARPEIELIVVSPLTRAIQTMLIGFANHAGARLVHDLHREHLQNFCDVGRSPALLAKEYPQLAFHHLDNPWWYTSLDGDAVYAPEPDDMFQARVTGFESWLKARPEAELAVVGHGTFLRHLTGEVFGNGERKEIDLKRD